MALGYVEELALRYFDKRDYLVFPNIRFQLKKERTGKKVAGWSDIDLIALKSRELIIVQCKSFIGTKKAEKIADELKNWFDNVVYFLKEDNSWKNWLRGRVIKKYLIVDFTIKKVEFILEQKGIKIFYYGELLKELLKILKFGKRRKGKEDDAIIRLLCAMIDKKMINPDLIKT